MYLDYLIQRLQKEDPERIIKLGFNNPHSYRGNYSELAFEPATNVKIGDMLKNAIESKGKVFQGYKGGDNLMEGYTRIWLSEYGRASGESLGKLLIEFLLHPETPDIAEHSAA